MPFNQAQIAAAFATAKTQLTTATADFATVQNDLAALEASRILLAFWGRQCFRGVVAHSDGESRPWMDVERTRTGRRRNRDALWARSIEAAQPFKPRRPAARQRI